MAIPYRAGVCPEVDDARDHVTPDAAGRSRDDQGVARGRQDRALDSGYCMTIRNDVALTGPHHVLTSTGTKHEGVSHD